ncbi:MAG: calcium/proton exchanger [Pseudomonadaceae bacterium]|nr:calcium/proton exchanger [Pseudomonadaceae bacterium]
MLNWLLLCVPFTLLLEFFAPGQHLLIFFAAAVAIIPLAGWLGRATEQLAERSGDGIGGLLNATFGNATELIIAFAALRAGLHEVVKASIAGSIIGNILLVLGAAMLCGGLRFKEQHFNTSAARASAGMLMLAAIALVLPAIYMINAQRAPELLSLTTDLSQAISVVLLAVYGLFLYYSLVSHKELFAGEAKASEIEQPPLWSIGKALLVLGIATALIAWVSEILVGAIEPSAKEFGLSKIFIGVFVVAILGNAAEHATAISAAMKNRMDLALSIAIGSSVQVALFVAPVLVLSSLFIGDKPMDLAFSAGLTLTVLLSVIITTQVAGDGRSDWLKGALLLAVYAVFGLAFFFIPAVYP